MKTRPLITIFLILLIIALCVPVKTQNFNQVHEVCNIIYDLVKVAPRRKIAKNYKFRLEMAKDVYKSASSNKVPEFLHTVNIYRESSFRKNALSENAEWYGLG